MTDITERDSWNKYFMDMAIQAATRSTCVRRKVGAVAVDDRHRIIATGYNGTPPGCPHCTAATCLRNVNHVKSGERPELSRAVHAEQNVVAHAGRELVGSTVYVTNKCCISCFKLLLAAGVTVIIWNEDYDDAVSRFVMNELGSVDTTAEGYHRFKLKY